jgi:hypothetical protein
MTPDLYEAEAGSRRLFKAQLRANMVFGRTMADWHQRHEKPVPRPPRVPQPDTREHIALKPYSEPLGQRVLAHVVKRSGVPLARILSKKRGKGAWEARLRAIRLLRRCGYSLTNIGRVMNIHHSTVLYALRKLRGAG